MKKFWIALPISFIPLIIFYFIPAFRGDIIVESGFTIGSLTIRYYGLLFAVAILACFFAAVKLAPRFGIDKVHVENALPWVVIFGLAGARFYFVSFTWDYFSGHIGEIAQIWKGGFSIYGGVIGGALGLYIYAKKNRLPVLNFFDLIAVALPLGQAIGRFGNFFNQEAFGGPTDLPWKLYISPAYRPADVLTEKFYHPAFLYEAVWDLFVFSILWRAAKSTKNPGPPLMGRRPRGSLFGIYLILYSMGRFFIESLRMDSFFWHDAYRIDQITALAMILVGLTVLIITRKSEFS